MRREQLVDSWLNRLEVLQTTAPGGVFPAGSFPSKRIYPVTGTVRADPNVFFPALIAGKLLEWMHVMDEGQKIRSTVILKKIEATFPLHKSRRGRMHYNFWPTDPDIPFPNGRLLHKLGFFRLPDDIDDTSMVYEASQAAAEQVKSLQRDIERHFLEHYPDQPRVYAAWLGDKMPFVVDVCAMTNLLNVFNKCRLPATAYSAGSRAFLLEVIALKTYVSCPYKVSPYYPDTAVIAYHLAKWLSLAGDQSAECKQLTRDLEELAGNEMHPFRRMLYACSLLRLQAAENRHVSFEQVKPYLTTFPWFYGSMLSAVKWKILRQRGDWRIFHIAHVCEAWNYSLWTEYQLLIDTAKQ